jgi:hypothetical protein
MIHATHTEEPFESHAPGRLRLPRTAGASRIIAAVFPVNIGTVKHEKEDCNSSDKEFFLAMPTEFALTSMLAGS